MATITSFLPISSSNHGFGSKLGQKLKTSSMYHVIKTKYASSSSSSSSLRLQVKAKAHTPGTVNATTIIGAMDYWSMILAAITTVFMQHEMMFNSKKKKCQDIVSDDIGDPGRMIDGFVFRQNFNIKAYETGPDRTTCIETLLNLMQETAINHSKTIGLLGGGLAATPEMNKRNLIWVVTKMQIVIDCYPTCGDVVQIDTWRAVSGKNSGRTDWLFCDSQTGKILVRASSNWVMMNKETRRLSKFPDEARAELKQYFVDKPPIIEEEARKYQKLDNKNVCVHNGLVATWKDLDMNQHVNNVKYFGWILESVPKPIEEMYELASMTLEYRRECRKGSVLQSETCIVENVDGIDVVDYKDVDCQHLLRFEGDSGGEIVKGRTHWRPKCENKINTQAH